MAFARITNLVSVIIPCFNATSYIVDSLNSIVAQTYPDIEIIIVNDGSTDSSVSRIRSWLSTKEIQSRYVKKDRVRLLGLPYNVGYAGANTMGMFLAKGEFIAIQDADDLSHPERIQKQVDFLRKHAHIGLVGTNIAEFRTNKPKVYAVPKFIQYGHERILAKYEKGSAGACYGSLLLRGGVFDHSGGMIRSLPRQRVITGHDTIFISNCLKKGYKIDNIPEVLYYYRLHSTQMSGRGNR